MNAARPTWLVLLTLATSLWAGSARAAGFIGPASCRVCHESAYEQWKSSPHAKALDSLPAADRKNPQCLQCHARDAAQGGDSGVTCETCHGAGQYYWPNYVMRDSEVARGAGLIPAPDAKSCAMCHDASTPSLKPFDPVAAMQAIDHWSKDRAARKAKSAEACPRHEPASVRQAAAASMPNESFLGRVLTGRWGRSMTAGADRRAAAERRAD